MTAAGVALGTFLLVAVAGLVGLRFRLAPHLDVTESRDAVRLSQGIVASMSALLLSLLLVGATGHYRSQGEEVRRLAAQILTLDRILAELGPHAAPARATLRTLTESAIAQIWQAGPRVVAAPQGTEILNQIVAVPQGDARTSFLQARALDQLVSLTQLRTTLITAGDETALQAPMLVTLVIWFALLFLAIGLFARPNAVSVGAVLFGSAAVSSALFMVLELDQPFDGLMAISPTVMHQALAALGAP